MVLEQLQKQKVAYQTLLHALERNELAHAYLFTGDAGTPKKECAYLLAQSILCDEKAFACETCDTCVRLKNNLYADFVYIDGISKSIKKQDILNLQKQFSQTSLEKKGKKIYIVDGVDNATADALNSILKFLEEPQEDTYAILIAQHSDRILETIVSRCQIIPFYKHSEALEMQLRTKMEPLDAHLLSGLCAHQQQAIEMSECEEYQHALYVFQNFVQSYETPARAGVFLQNEIVGKGKRDDKQVWQIFLHCIKQICKDSYILTTSQLQNIWGKNSEIMLKLKRDQIWRIATETNDKIVRSANIALLVDQFLYKWEEVWQNNSNM